MLLAAESSIGRVKSMLNDSMQTLSGLSMSDYIRIAGRDGKRTNIVSFIKDDNRILRNFF